ncbi:MAG TPA: bifunctional riboflavin kinase/FAD synthetase [Thermodesulfobacteriota bacterium]|nr:bifunctional riboflavin kinase/FAD synthetase [Thermodesulfobacteriota bacterium]
MEVIKGYKNLNRKLPNPVVTLGNFDGVHLGHQAIFSRVIERAKEIQGTSLVYTFHPHPLSVLTQGGQFLHITTLAEKLNLIETAGIDVVICEPFTLEFSQLTAEEFVKNILCNHIGTKEIFVGEDYTFGSKRQGNIYFLTTLGKRLNFRVNIIESQIKDHIIVKSSKIRELIQMGEVEIAHRLLGREYSITGQIIKGKGRGIILGYPTANIKPNKALHPGVGVYAVWVKCDNKQFPGVMNIGYNPTFSGQELSLEVYIFDFNRDLYGKKIEISFVARIRKEKRFASPDELKAQIAEDVSAARKILGIN